MGLTNFVDEPRSSTIGSFAADIVEQAAEFVAAVALPAVLFGQAVAVGLPFGHRLDFELVVVAVVRFAAPVAEVVARFVRSAEVPVALVVVARVISPSIIMSQFYYSCMIPPYSHFLRTSVNNFINKSR
jgi:hypothetical protein